MNRPISIPKVNSIELHYWFNDSSHYMDAMVFNQCEHEALCIIKELADKLKIDVEIVTEPLSNGGIRSWLTIRSDDSDTIKTIKISILTALFGTLLISPLQTCSEESTKQIIEYILEDPSIRELKKTKEKLELELDIDKLEKDLKNRAKTINDTLIKKKKSNFYNTLKNYPKVTDISISIANKDKKIIEENKITRNDFDKYILSTDELDPETNESAVIEIVSPVLKKGKYKWVGIYQGNIIHFNMKSAEFKTLVLSGCVIFKNGSFIECTLITNKKVNSEGKISITGYDVIFVKSYTENGIPTETPEAKKKRQIYNADERQGKLF